MSENKNAPFLEVRDLVVEYTSEGQVVHAVNGVSFTLEKGRTLALAGETGAGKTTIAKTILRILPDYSASSRARACSRSRPRRCRRSAAIRSP